MKLGIRQLALFAAPAVPIAALGMPLLIYLPPFYADDLSLGLAAVGSVFMFTRFWDIFTDAILGSLTDAVRTRWGRRRPWIVLSVPIIVLAVWRLFLPPEDAGLIYLLVWLVVLYVGWTMITISHMAWGAELSDDYHVRSRLMGWRQVALLIGMVTVLALPAIVERKFGGGGWTRAAAIGWFIMGLLPVAVAASVLGVGERPVRDTGEERASSLRAYRLALANPLVWRLLAADVLAGSATGVTASLYIFFVEHAMHLGEHTSLLLLSYFVVGLISVPIWVRLSYRFGKHRTFGAAMLYMAATLPLVLLLEPGNVYTYAGANVIYGLGFGAAPVLLRSITADITDDDAVRSGTQRAGLFYSLLAMTNKLGLAVAVGGTYVLLDVVGFDPNADNGPGAIAGLRYVFALAPAVCFALSAAVMWRFPLDENRQTELREKVGA